MSEPSTEPIDPDGDPAELNPRDLRGVSTGDGAAADPGAGDDPDADPEQLNPRDDA
ncbi:hypothetical protein GCM10027586_08770 [Kineococcus gypseus]|uniref:hypothetical protein n=1 Tax=Kineococcus gypseus TaxID=1637102 RepID=UPI003D7D9A14